nr:fumarylacetoacetate hydrolase family protein [Pseudomonadota bacterium]
MKLVRFGNRGEEKTGILLNESADGSLEVADLSSIIPDFDENFFRNDGLAKLKKEYQQIVESAPKVKGKLRLGAPVARPANFICIGLNYKEHAKESGAAIPTEPIIFMKHTGSYNGPFDNVVIPKESEQTDWEVELG